MVKGPMLERGYELIELVMSRYQNQHTLKFFVYAEAGVKHEACAELSRMIGDIFEETDMFESGYTLEVSSPGLDRPLKTLRDYEIRVGETVRLTFAEAKRKKIKAEIVGSDDGKVLFKNKDGSFAVSIDELKEAKIIF